MDGKTIAREWVRVLRGQRSQLALSRRLGYRTNVVHTWEAGRRWCRASEFFRCAHVVGVDVQGGLEAFFTSPPRWLEAGDLRTDDGVTRVLQELHGGIMVNTLAERCGVSRHAVSRWLRGAAQPRIHEFLDLVHAMTDRLLDFLEGFVDPGLLPSVAPPWRSYELARQVLVLEPWSHAVLVVLSLPSYRALPTHAPGWIAGQIGIPADVEARCVEQLAAAGLIRWQADRYEIVAEPTLDSRKTPDAGKRLQAHWARAALERIESGGQGRFSFNVFAVSRADLVRIEALHLEYFRAVRSIVAASEPEVAAAVNVQLMPLSSR
ncbi:MAG: DUF4423 domain-containing protein [Myxococcales bacterium]|nr:DUF4423 domain-containing protein [Myxococcales bacterium]